MRNHFHANTQLRQIPSFHIKLILNVDFRNMRTMDKIKNEKKNNNNTKIDQRLGRAV